MIYTVVVLHEVDGRYTVLVPALKGCTTWGETLPEALRMAEEAILAYLEGLQELGKEFPNDVETVSFDWNEAQEASVYRIKINEVVAVTPNA